MLSWELFSSIFFCLVFVYYSSIIVRCILHRRKYSKLLPGKRFSSLNLLGNMSQFPLKRSSRNGYPESAFALQYLSGFTELFRKEKLFCYWIGYTPVVVVVKAEAVRELLVLSKAKSLKKPWTYELLQTLLGNGLVTSEVEKWKYNRKLLNPCFHFGILKDFLCVFNENARKLILLLQKETNKDFTEIATPVTLCSLDIINEAVLGIRLEDLNISGSENIKAIKRIEKFTIERLVNWWGLSVAFRGVAKLFSGNNEYDKYLSRFRWMKTFTKTVFEKKKSEFLSGNLPQNNRKAFIDLLLEIHLHQDNFTETDVVDELDTLLAAGHETTSASICWTLYFLGLHKDVQKRAQDELDFIFGDDAERPVTLEDVKDFKYLDCVIKECRRLYPSVSLFSRELENDTEICGYVIPKRTIIVVPSYTLHRDEEVFPNPEKFDPERFLPENFAKIPHQAYLPFSSGPRDCIGKNFAILSEKVIVSTILRNFCIESLDPRDRLVPTTEITLQPTIPIRLRLRPRTN